MKIFFLILPLFFFTRFSFAQSKKADSLKSELQYAKQDSAKGRLLINLCISYVYAFPDSAVKYGEQALQTDKKDSSQIGDRKLKMDEITVFNAMGEALGIKGDYVKNLALQLKALQLAESIGNNILIHRCLFFIGTSYIHAKNFRSAINYFYEIKPFALIRHDAEDLNDVTNIANEQYVDAFIGGCSLSLNKLDSAQYYLQRACQLDLKNKVHSGLSYALMGQLRAQKGQYQDALYYVRVALKYSDANFMKIDRYTEFAEIFHKTGATDSSVYYAKKVIKLAQHASIGEEIILASQILTETYAAKHETDSAFKYQGILLAAKDSLFSREKVLGFQDIAYKEAKRQQELTAARAEIINQIRIYVLIAALAIFLLIGAILWRSNRKQQKANREIKKTLAELKATQTQLIQSEKMASLGELTAGIAHEIQNPLNFVNNFSEVSVELLTEMENELKNGDASEAISISEDVKQNLEKITYHGKRADAIVKGMLQHSRSSSGQKEPTDINELADEYLRLTYHGLRAKDKSFNATMETNFDENIGQINISPQDIGRVILNLLTNAFYAVTEKKRAQPDGYEPIVTVTTKLISSHSGGPGVAISVRDNGNGIPQEILDKIYQPFFTTKPTGQGTGLGLSMSYDIVKAHGGELKVETKEGGYTEFSVLLPK